MKPRVSVVIPCWNAARWIEETIRSALEQSGVDVEVIVVDDGSTDGSADVVTAMADPRITLLRQPNSGPGAARARALQHCHGAFVQFLDADDLLLPGTLRARVDALERARADVAYCDWAQIERTLEGDFQVSRTMIRELGSRPEVGLLTDAWFPPVALLYRRQVTATADWTEQFPTTADAGYAQDVALRGARFVRVPGVGATYRVVHDSMSRRASQREFVRDCFRNGERVETWCRSRNALDAARRQALLYVYAHVARASYEHDRPTFEAACDRADALQPGWVPHSPLHLALVARVLGYRRAEWVALRYRKLKGLLRALAGRARAPAEST